MRKPIKRTLILGVGGLPDVFAQAFARFGIQIDEDKPVPAIGGDRRQSVAFFVKVEKLSLIGSGDGSNPKTSVVHRRSEFSTCNTV